MKSFNLGGCCFAIKMLGVYTAASLAATNPNQELPESDVNEINNWLTRIQVYTITMSLVESTEAIKRQKNRLDNKITYSDIYHSLKHLLELIESEMEKRKVFFLDSDKDNFFQNLDYGTRPPPEQNNALMQWAQPVPLFGEAVTRAFPSAFMDTVEAGRCLALERNNAAVYHLMQVAEIGLRTLAWDRRVEVKQRSRQAKIPLEFAQWGQLIGELQKKLPSIHQWQRSKALRGEAHTFYSDAIFEVSSFNEIYRKHIAHARGTVHKTDVAISCWGHVNRFMNRLAERMSETHRMPTVWSAKALG